jgi:hypothetical protein
MAFITRSNKAVGDVVTVDDINTSISNEQDLNTRTSALEGASNLVIVFDVIVGNAILANTMTGLTDYKAKIDFTLTFAEVQIYETNSLAGILEVDVKKSTTDLDNASFSSVFTTRPSINFATASDYDSSTNQVFDLVAKDISTGDYLRLDVTQLPTNGVISKFRFTLYGEPL